ncbi:MAG: PH domain-containing protein [Myxococcaceae bacterium]
MAASADAQVYRPRWVLGASMGAAAALWLAALVFLMRLGGVPTTTVLTAAAFLLFFAVAGAYYARTAIFVDGRGLTVRSLTRTDRFSFREIHRVEVLRGPVTVYSVKARGRYFHFTSFFKHHRTLAALVADRAGLNTGR